MGWTGGSGCLVSPDFGPWLLLGELILDVTLEYDCPVPSRCGDCGRCASACPTGAIVEPGLIDANRCVAYLTIEHRGAIPRPLRPLVGDRIFGCDSCQECCAWPSVGSSNVRDAERIASDSPRDCEVRLPACYPAERLLVMTPAEFAAAFAGTPVLRASRARMARNAAVVLGNAPGPSSVAALGTALRDPEPLVRSHAAWALGRLNARGALSRRLGREPDRGVKAEIKLALRGGGRKTS
jgi:epoxyqueuosine reductase